jgi:DNA invertase Pin-like site-specific DNA recombinase
MLASRRVRRLQARRRVASEAREAKASRAAGYIRVSTEEQATHGHGLEAQERSIRAFADSQGYELLDVVSDPGVSGATRPNDRAGFGRLVALAAAGQVSVLLVWKFDRLARQIVYAVTAVQDLAEAGIAIRSVTEPIDTATPMGRTIFAVLAGMAEQEREAITERTWHGRREKATRGGYACGGVPYGYDVDADGSFVINALEAEHVRAMFEARAAKATYQQIADYFNVRGIRTRRGRVWRAGTVAYVLDNPVYRGEVEYLFRRFGADAHVLVGGNHAAIVSDQAERPEVR